MTSATEPVAPGLLALNTADAGDVRARLLALTASPLWADDVVAGRPYADVETVLAHSDTVLAGLGEDQLDAALAGHPRIGEGSAHPDEASAARSAREQAGMNSAGAEQKSALAEANAAYEQRFGRIYLVAAAGLSASQLLAKVQARLGNEPGAELEVVRAELAEITRSRLQDWLAS